MKLLSKSKKYTMRKILLYLLIILSIKSFSQEAPGLVNIQSPNVAGLGLYGEIPVSLYSGLPEINIPLCTMQGGTNLKIPISLSYHASGVKPDQRSGWTGTGWNLNGIAVITRVIKGDHGDDYNHSVGLNGKKAGYYYNTNRLKSDNWNSIQVLQNIISERRAKFTLDCEPDEFQFILPNGLNGKFYLDDNKQWVVKCDEKVSIFLHATNITSEIPAELRLSSYNIDKNTENFFGFFLKTSDGTLYQFGFDHNAIEYSKDFYNQRKSQWVANAWYLTKINTINYKEINFKYEKDKYKYITQLTFGLNIALSDVIKNGNEILNSCSQSLSSVDQETLYNNTGGQLISPVYLAEINTDYGKITFKRSASTELKYNEYYYTRRLGGEVGHSTAPHLGEVYSENISSLDRIEWKKLDKIIVENYLGDTINDFGFTYNNNSMERLFLVSISDKQQLLYKLEYNKKEQLPPYLSNKLDHWGGYNGRFANLTTSQIYNYEQTRSVVDTTYSLMGLLKKIVYPTKGYTVFEYEANEYRKQININRTSCVDKGTNIKAGGARIKGIKNFDKDNKLLRRKEYQYVKNYLSANASNKISSGISGQIFKYIANYSLPTPVYITSNYENAITNKTAFVSNSVLPSCSNLSDSFIGYSCVIEINDDGSFTEYKFTNLDTNPDDIYENTILSSESIYRPYSSRAQERGKLLSKIEYNNEKRPIRETAKTYSILNNNKEFVKAVNVYNISRCGGSLLVKDATAYKNYTYSYLPVKEITKNYDGVSAVIDSTIFTYNSFKQLSSITEIKNNEYEYITTYEYMHERADRGQLYAAYLSQFWLNYMVTEKKVAKQVATNTKNTLYEKQYEYRTGYPVVINYKVKDEALTKNFDYITPAGKLNPTKIIEDNYKYTHYIWDTKEQYPIAIIKSHSPNIDTRNFDRIRESNPEAFVSTYTYKPMVGVLTMTDPKGIKTYYDYDKLGRLIEVYIFENEQKKIIESYIYNFSNQ